LATPLAGNTCSGARRLFRRAADWGFAPAALRLAATYDASELRRLQVEGVAADRNEARKWYERARELGAPEAEERLADWADDRLRYQYHDLASDLKKLQRRIKATEAPQKESA
jgi:TPR repeat protein